jgi:hypothetical protein
MRLIVAVVSRCTTAMSKNVPASIWKSVTLSRPAMSGQYPSAVAPEGI